MSVENLKEYARRCATEPELLQSAREIGFDLQDLDKHMVQAEGLGLEWNMDDWDTFRKEVVEIHTSSDELQDLDEGELEQVAGGLFSVTLVSAVAVGAAVGTTVAAVGGAAAAGGATAAGDGGW